VDYLSLGWFFLDFKSEISVLIHHKTDLEVVDSHKFVLVLACNHLVIKARIAPLICVSCVIAQFIVWIMA
jgi:hypothetical protein